MVHKAAHIRTNSIGSISSVEEIIEDVKQGRPVIMVDDEDRENEGDIIVAAECITADHVAFMAKFGSGLICLAIDGTIAERLQLERIGKNDSSVRQTAFAMPFEAKIGISTGISASDRAHSIKVAIKETSQASDIATPGHVFPVIAVSEGVLGRNGHTEASVDLASLAGYTKAGVMCEVMNSDGTMARLPDLYVFAQEHGLKIGTIADLIKYRLGN